VEEVMTEDGMMEERGEGLMPAATNKHLLRHEQNRRPHNRLAAGDWVSLLPNIFTYNKMRDTSFSNAL